MWWPGRGNSGGSWLPEEKKANMWPGRGNSDGSWPPAFPRSFDLPQQMLARWDQLFERLLATNKQTPRRTNIQTYRHTDVQTYRRTDIQIRLD